MDTTTTGETRALSSPTGTASPATGPSQQRGASVQLKESLRGLAYSQQEEMLTPGTGKGRVGSQSSPAVQRRVPAPGAAATPAPAAAAEPAAAPTETTEATVTHAVLQPAPGDSNPARTRIGVCERVEFTAPGPGARWRASGGTRTGRGQYWGWFAPDTPGTVTITCDPGGGAAQQTLTFTVVAPEGVEGTRTQDFSGSASGPWREPPLPGTVRAGMTIRMALKPYDVSFSMIDVREEFAPASGRDGFFAFYEPIAHDSANPDGTSVGDGNIISAEDTAAYQNVMVPERSPLQLARVPGFFQWIIPMNYSKYGGGPTHRFGHGSYQRFFLTADGKLKITKAGAEVRGGIDGRP